MSHPVLETPRLLLRPFTPADAPALLKILGDRKANTFLPWFPVGTLEEALAFYERRFSPAALVGGYAYAVCPKGAAPVGYVTGEVEGACDLGYGLHPNAWGQGFATEAAGVLLEQMRRDGVPFVTATHDRENPRSGRVMQKLGMVYRYSYREQWQPKDLPVVFRMYQRNLDGREDRVYRGYWERYPEHFVEPGLE